MIPRAQYFNYAGTTADGRPYYIGSDSNATWLYYTTNCGGLGFNVWGRLCSGALA